MSGKGAQRRETEEVRERERAPRLLLDPLVKVEYESAHLEGMVSELHVRSGHSLQAHPDSINEVKRILREHLTEIGL